MSNRSSTLPALRGQKRPFVRMLAVAGLALAGVSAPSFAAGLVFSDDFEAGNTNKWGQDGGRNKCVVVSQATDGGTPAAGQNMAECNWNGTVAWDAPSAYSTLRLASFNYSKEFLMRMKVRFASDVDHKFGAKAFRIYGTDSYYFGAQMEQSGGPLFSYFETINGSAGPMTYGAGTTVGDGKWHEIEIYVKHNDSGANGALKVWVDGKLLQSASNAVTATAGAKWFPIYIMSNWSNNGPEWAHDAANHVYWDNFEIYSDNGTGGSGSMADGTMGGTATTAKTPNPPTDVRLN